MCHSFTHCVAFSPTLGLTKCGTNIAIEWDKQWQRVGLTVAKSVGLTVAMSGTNSGKKVGLTVAISGTNSGKEWD